MTSTTKKQPIGVVGAGSFGTAIAQLLSIKNDVLIHTRRDAVVKAINEDHFHKGQTLSERIRAINSMEEMAEECTLIFPMVASANFRDMMRDFSPYLRPFHMLIHGTKGLDTMVRDTSMAATARDRVHTMSEVIRQESSVIRVGCLSGPNLSSEIMEGQPAATVIASEFDEVIKAGIQVLRSPQFQIYGTYDLTGAELAGALKNIIALASGILGGLGLGYNLWGLLITRGLIEMIHLGKAMGAQKTAFFGLAGVGDLVATASSQKSRNYTFGYHLAKGKKVEEILEIMTEPAEGYRTLKVAKEVSEYYQTHTPIIDVLYNVLYEGEEIAKSLQYLIKYPYTIDVDFM
ncbi:MAG: NAD(P)H-dependent glycerol-3-phosphate dehydrogenase [Bacteroidota bacterium]